MLHICDFLFSFINWIDVVHFSDIQYDVLQQNFQQQLMRPGSKISPMLADLFYIINLFFILTFPPLSVEDFHILNLVFSAPLCLQSKYTAVWWCTRAFTGNNASFIWKCKFGLCHIRTQIPTYQQLTQAMSVDLITVRSNTTRGDYVRQRFGWQIKLWPLCSHRNEYTKPAYLSLSLSLSIAACVGGSLQCKSIPLHFPYTDSLPTGNVLLF